MDEKVFMLPCAKCGAWKGFVTCKTTTYSDHSVVSSVCKCAMCGRMVIADSEQDALSLWNRRIH